jgi:hypothetical protein
VFGVVGSIRVCLSANLLNFVRATRAGNCLVSARHGGVGLVWAIYAPILLCGLVLTQIYAGAVVASVY